MSDSKRARVGRWIAGLAVAALVLGLAEAQFHVLGRFFGAGPLTTRELAMEYLGRFLAAHHAGQKVVVLSNPFSQQPGQPPEVYRYERAGVQGLRRGLGSAMEIQAVAFPELKAGFLQDRRSVRIDPDTTTPLSYVVADHALDKIAAEHPQAEILVSLIGLPLNVRQTETWKASNPRKFGLLLPDLRMIGDQSAIREAFANGKIAVAVMNKPGAPPEDQPMGKDSKMEFDRRFLLVSKDTIDRVLRDYPRLFR